jgi:outer membrane receptor protein involved in Fe transport
MDDDELGGEIGWSMPLPALGYDTARVNAGGFYTDRDRDFQARRFRFVPRSGVRPDSMDLTLPAEQIYTAENIRTTGFQLQELTRATDAYSANQVIKGGFVQGDVSFLSRYRLIAGARYEDSRQRLGTFELGNPDGVPVVATNIGAQWAPSASFVIKTSDKTNVRLAASRTLNRPDFRELAPFEYTEFVGGRSEIGNPELEDAVIRNYDVRWERYPAVGELMAASFFFKDFDRPIETVVLPGVSRMVTYANSDDAQNYGIELEYRRALGHVWSKLADFNIGVNLTLVKSEVVIGDSTGVQTSAERPLQGQSPYVFNGNLAYTFMGGRANLILLYNLYGKRISEVGANGLPDVYERHRNQIDLTGATGIGRHMKLKFAAEDILNHQVRFEQGGLVTRAYTPGRSFKFGVGYNM